MFPALPHRRPPSRRTRRPISEFRAIEHPHAELVGRDYELQDVLSRIAASLGTAEQIGTPEEHDERLSSIEAEAAPYVLALLLEIQRLDAIVINLRRRRVR